MIHIDTYIVRIRAATGEELASYTVVCKGPATAVSCAKMAFEQEHEIPSAPVIIHVKRKRVEVEREADLDGPLAGPIRIPNGMVTQ